MIEDGDIAKFPLDKQLEIRATIELRLKSGYDLKYLILSRDGTVMYDPEAQTLDAISEALSKLKGPPR